VFDLEEVVKEPLVVPFANTKKVSYDGWRVWWNILGVLSALIPAVQQSTSKAEGRLCNLIVNWKKDRHDEREKNTKQQEQRLV